MEPFEVWIAMEESSNDGNNCFDVKFPVFIG